MEGGGEAADGAGDFQDAVMNPGQRYWLTLPPYR